MYTYLGPSLVPCHVTGIADWCSAIGQIGPFIVQGCNILLAGSANTESTNLNIEFRVMVA